MLNPSRWLKAIFGSPAKAKSPIAKKRVAVRLGFDPLEDRLVPTTGFFGGAFDTVVADTKALGQLFVAPGGVRTLMTTSISNAAQSFGNAAQNAPEALELGSIATKNLSNGINQFWDTYAGGDTLLDKVPAFAGKALTSEVTGTLDALSAVTHVTSKVTTVVRDHANGKAVGPADVVIAAWQGIKDKKDDLTQAVLSVATSRIAKSVVPETPGRKPQQILTILTGKHAQDTVARSVVDQIVSIPLDAAANRLLAPPKSSPAIASGHASGSSSSQAKPTAAPSKTQATPTASNGHNSGSSSSAPAHSSQPSAPAPKVAPVVKTTQAPAPKAAPAPAKTATPAPKPAAIVKAPTPPKAASPAKTAAPAKHK